MDWTGAGAAAISGGTGVVGSLLNYFNQRSANQTYLQGIQATNDANLALAQKQNDFNVDMWHRQNEYNSPSNQIRLLQDAGLNPNLYSGQGSTAGSVQSSNLANQQAPGQVTAPQLDMATPVQSTLATLQSKATIEELRAQIAESKQRQDLADGINPYLVIKAGLENDYLYQSGLLAAEQTTSAQNANASFWRRWQAEQDILKNQYRITQHQAGTADYERRIARENWNNTVKFSAQERQLALDVQRYSLDLSKQLGPHQVQKLLEDIRQVEYSNDVLGVQAKLAKDYGINPSSSALTNIVSMALVSPDSYNKVLDSMLNALDHTVGHILDKLNPFN